MRAVILELCVIQVVQNLHFKIRGENVVKGGLDVFHEQGLDIAFFKVVGTVEDKRIALMSTASNSSNQVAMVVSESSPFSWDSTLSHTSATEFKKETPLLVKK